jgi:hypothetical protein
VPERVTVGEQFVPEQPTVSVELNTPATFGLNNTEPVVQLVPALSTAPGVQVPLLTEKSAPNAFKLSKLALKRIGPPVAVTVMLPQLIAVPPTVIEPHAKAVGFTETVPKVPVPVILKLVLVPVVVFTVTVEARLSLVCGLKVIVPVAQVVPAPSTLLAVQVPRGRLKSRESLKLNGVAPKVTEPPLAVKVTVVQLLVEPTAVVGHATGTVAAESVPKVVAVKVADPATPVVGVTVTKLDGVPAAVGLKITLPVVQDEPEFMT